MGRDDQLERAEGDARVETSAALDGDGGASLGPRFRHIVLRVDRGRKCEIVVELVFKDNSKKIVEIPVLVNSKVDGSYKFLSAEEVKNLDKNDRDRKSVV